MKAISKRDAGCLEKNSVLEGMSRLFFFLPFLVIVLGISLSTLVLGFFSSIFFSVPFLVTMVSTSLTSVKIVNDRRFSRLKKLPHKKAPLETSGFFAHPEFTDSESPVSVNDPADQYTSIV